MHITNQIESIGNNIDRVILMKNGQITGDGSPTKILTSDNISNLFEIPIKVNYISNNWFISAH